MKRTIGIVVQPGAFHLPNALSLTRLLGVPVLFVLVDVQPVGWFIALYAFLGFTDWLDGVLARAWNMTSEFGSRLDAIADLAYYLSTAYFAWRLFPDYVRPNLPYIIAVVALYPTLLLVGKLRAGRVVLPHTHLSRVAGAVVVVVVFLSFFIDTTWWLRGTILLYGVAFVEQILMVWIYGDVPPDTRTILSLRR